MSKIDEQLLRDILETATFRKMKLEDIEPAPYNPRVDLTPDDWEYQQIELSINSHGLVQPIIFNKRTGYAVGGNQRMKVLKDHGITEATCAVIDVPLMTEMEINLALNRLGNSWDYAKLREDMIIIQESGYDPTLTAFSDAEIADLTRDMNASVESFFEQEQTISKDGNEEEEPEPEKPKRKYKCPLCGEIFER